MAEAKITLKTIVEDKGLNDLNDELAKGQQNVKSLTRELKALEKQTNKGANATKEQANQMKELVKQINQQKQANTSLNRNINETIKGMGEAGKSAKGFLDQLKQMGSAKLGINLEQLTNIKFGWIAVASAVATVGKVLADGSREVAKFSNQFIPFSANMQHATEMYAKFNEVARNMNSSYDEQQIYDMAKSLLAVGINADESAKLITLCADASAKLGRGAEFTNELVDAFKRLKTGGELTEKQYKSLAEAGIDLTDVQEQIRQGGEAGYNALAESLKKYEGGMNSTKQTSEEMEADISANIREIIRMSGELADEFLEVSVALKEFYQWVIDTSGAVIQSIKNMISALRDAKVSANAYADAMQEWEEIYGKDFQGTDDERMRVQMAYANATADVVAETEKQKQESIKETTEAMKKQVKSIAKSSGGGGGGSKSSSGSKSADRIAQEEERKYQGILRETEKIESDIASAKSKGIQIARQMFAVGKDEIDMLKAKKDWATEDAKTQIAQEETLHNNRIEHLKEQVKYYEANAGLPASAKTIEALNQQIAKENELHSVRLDNIKSEKEERIASIEETLSKLGVNDDPAGDVSSDGFNGLSQGLEKFMQAKTMMKSIGIEMTKLQTLTLNTFGKSFTTAFDSIVNGTKSVKEAFGDMVKEMLTQCLNLLAQWTMIFAMVTMFKGPKVGTEVANKMVLGLKNGGLVSGKGGSRDDKVPAMLSDGEYVLNAKAVDSLGVGYLDSLNAGENPVADVMPIGGSSVALSINTLDASSFSDFLGRGGLDGIKQALFDDDLNFASAVGTF